MRRFLPLLAALVLLGFAPVAVAQDEPEDGESTRGTDDGDWLPERLPPEDTPVEPDVQDPSAPPELPAETRARIQSLVNKRYTADAIAGKLNQERMPPGGWTLETVEEEIERYAIRKQEATGWYLPVTLGCGYRAGLGCDAAVGGGKRKRGFGTGGGATLGFYQRRRVDPREVVVWRYWQTTLLAQGSVEKRLFPRTWLRAAVGAGPALIAYDYFDITPVRTTGLALSVTVGVSYSILFAQAGYELVAAEDLCVTLPPTQGGTTECAPDPSTFFAQAGIRIEFDL